MTDTPPGAVGIFTDKNGHVIASVSDFDRSSYGGFTLMGYLSMFERTVSDTPTLADRMEAHAQTMHDGPMRREMFARAAELRDGIAGFYGAPQTVDVKAFMGCWARARALWCMVTGEPLI
jgi:hypothetical protein